MTRNEAELAAALVAARIDGAWKLDDLAVSVRFDPDAADEDRAWYVGIDAAEGE